MDQDDEALGNELEAQWFEVFTNPDAMLDTEFWVRFMNDESISKNHSRDDVINLSREEVQAELRERGIDTTAATRRVLDAVRKAKSE